MTLRQCLANNHTTESRQGMIIRNKRINKFGSSMNYESRVTSPLIRTKIGHREKWVSYDKFGYNLLQLYTLTGTQWMTALKNRTNPKKIPTSRNNNSSGRKSLYSYYSCLLVCCSPPPRKVDRVLILYRKTTCGRAITAS